MNRLCPLNLAVLLGVLVLCSGVAVAAVIHVPADYPQINAAVAVAAPGDTVRVAAGTYTDCTHPTEGPGSTPACVIMRPGVTLIGAGPAATIIDAEELGRGIYVGDVAGVRIENLQVIRANAPTYGAGILVRGAGAEAAVSDVRIADNLDGGVIVLDGAAATFQRVAFVNNEAKQGGGLAIEEGSTAAISACDFTNNSSPSGAGIFIRNGCTVTITGSTVVGNTITADFGQGGGIAVVTAHCDISGTEIRNNVTRGSGGGLAYIDGATGLVTDCEIIGNATAAAFNYGAGISCQSSAPTFRNLLIVDNAATSFGSDGGGIDIQFSPAPVVENCTLVGNSCSSGGEAGGILVQWGATPQIINCIVASSPVGAAMACVFGDAATVTGSNFWNNAGGNGICGIDGGCNFSADPLFCNPAAGNYGLQPQSPCAAGNHPAGGSCGQTHCGAFAAGCGTSSVDLPLAGRMLGNAPNPFNPQTTIFFVLDAPGDAMIRIFDMRGRLVRTFDRAGVPAQTRVELPWDGRDEAGRSLASGVYVLRLESGGVATTERMSLIR